MAERQEEMAYDWEETKDDLWHEDHAPGLSAFMSCVVCVVLGLISGGLLQHHLGTAQYFCWTAIFFVAGLLVAAKHNVERVHYLEKWMFSRIAQNISWFATDVREGEFAHVIYLFTKSTMMSLCCYGVCIIIGFFLQPVFPDFDFSNDGSWVDDALWLVLIIAGCIIVQLIYLRLRIHRLEGWGSVRIEEGVESMTKGNVTKDTFELFHKSKFPNLPAFASAVLCLICGVICGLPMQSSVPCGIHMIIAIYCLLAAIMLELFFCRHQFMRIDYLSHWTPTRLVLDLKSWEEKKLYNRCYAFCDMSCSKELVFSATCWIVGILIALWYLQDNLHDEHDQGHWPAVSVIFGVTVAVGLAFFAHHLSEKIAHMESWSSVWVEEKLEGNYHQNAFTGKGGMLAPLLRSDW